MQFGNICRELADGKIVEHWGEENSSEVLRHLGLKIKLEPVEK